MNSKLLSLAIGATLSLTSAFALADHSRHGDGNRDRDEWRSNQHERNESRERRHGGSRHWAPAEEPHHFRHLTPRWQQDWQHQHRHDRWCGHEVPIHRAPHGASHNYGHFGGFNHGGITFILRSDLD